MKKFGMFTMAIALLLPMAALTAAPAGAAGGTTCKPPSGTLTFSPGVGATLKAQTININLPIKGCVGGGVTGGTFKGTLKTAPTDIAMLTKMAANLKFPSTITWNTKATSTFTATSDTKIGKIITSKVTAKISKGLFAGLTLSSAQTVKYGPIVGGIIKTLNITGTGSLTIK
ncbi:MAG: hypothetical protein ACLPVY_00795 [Acidimicrobiia bacterium]